MYKVFVTSRFTKDLKKLFGKQYEDFELKLEERFYPQLKISPMHGANIKKLKNYKPETWRYRIGDYRFLYIIDSKNLEVVLIAADHRKDAY